MTFPRGVLLVSAVTFALFGAWAFASPASQVEMMEIGVPTATARADTRAQYGGFTLGMGVFLFVCFARRDWTAAGLAASAICLSGFVAARVVAVIADGPVAPTIYYLMLMEGSAAVLSFAGWRVVARTNPSTG